MMSKNNHRSAWRVLLFTFLLVLSVNQAWAPGTAIGDFVWEDLDGDGIQDQGEPGVAGVTVYLLSNPDGDADCEDTSLYGTTTTNEEGLYGFAGFPPGDYCVSFVKPDGYEFTLQDQGGNNATDSDADPNTGQTANTNIDWWEHDLTWDAGLIRPVTIGDFVWSDEDRDGLQDSGELGITGVIVNLYRCDPDTGDIDSDLIATQATDADGIYLFENLPPESYLVEFVKPAGLVFSLSNVGSDDSIDSDAIPVNGTGRSDCRTLPSGTEDLDVDAGLYQPLAGVGDRVWQDLNANGIQDDGEPGVAGATVELFGNADCSGTAIDTAETDADGIYGFENLIPGDYCVQFAPPVDLCQFGDSQFSPPNQGDDTADSDANPATGQTGPINLLPDVFDDTWDAGVYCPAKLGDLVWNDLDKDGLQDADEPGVDGVTVNLIDCASGTMVDSTTTSGGGLYGFIIAAGVEHQVVFELPEGFLFTAQNQGTDNAIDSDADPATGETLCVSVPSNTYDDTWDAGLVSQAECDIAVDKNCQVLQAAPSDFICADAKPLDVLTMISAEPRTISQIAYYDGDFDPNDPAKDLIGTIAGPINLGDEVAASGYAAVDAPNDVQWVMTFADGSTGISEFHRSCSDDEMNGPEDCGVLQGNGKGDDPDLLNIWELEGLAGNGLELDCTPPDPVPSTSNECSFELPPPPHCLDKLEAISLRYLGGECLISNLQDGKAECLIPGIAGEPVRIKLSDGGSKVYLDTIEANVSVGDVVTATAANAGEDDFASTSVIEIFSTSNNLVQQVEFHTSCSQPLNLGDQFGATEVVGMDTTEGGSVSLGAEVLYDYSFSNFSIEPLVGTAIDDKLGLIFDGTLAPGETATATETAFVLPDDSDVLTNTVLLSGTLEPSGTECLAQASATVTRELQQLPFVCDDAKPIDALSMIWNGAQAVDVIPANGVGSSLTVNPGEAITVSGIADTGNDQLWYLFEAGTRNLVGVSEFHVSCSDDDMDGEEDCGTDQGNGKGDDANLVNDWLLAGMAGNGLTLDCGLVEGGLPSGDGGFSGGPWVGFTPDAILKLEDDKAKIEDYYNYGTEIAVVVGVELSWPSEQGLLKKVKWEGDVLKEFNPPVASPQNLTLADLVADPNKRDIEPGEERKLELEFDTKYKDDLPSQYSFTVTFDDGTQLDW